MPDDGWAEGLDPYAVLGVPRDADDATIAEAHRRMMRQAHPDAGGDARSFNLVNAAYARVRTAPMRAALADPADRSFVERAATYGASGTAAFEEYHRRRVEEERAAARRAHDDQVEQLAARLEARTRIAMGASVAGDPERAAAGFADADRMLGFTQAQLRETVNRADLSPVIRAAAARLHDTRNRLTAEERAARAAATVRLRASIRAHRRRFGLPAALSGALIGVGAGAALFHGITTVLPALSRDGAAPAVLGAALLLGVVAGVLGALWLLREALRLTAAREARRRGTPAAVTEAIRRGAEVPPLTPPWGA